jgi:hypothetical protein
MPFRDAYNTVKNASDISLLDSSEAKNYSEGSPGNLNLDALEQRLKKQK